MKYYEIIKTKSASLVVSFRWGLLVTMETCEKKIKKYKADESEEKK